MRRFLLATNVLALFGLAVAMIATAGFGWKTLQAEAAPPPLAAPSDAPSKIVVFNMAAVMKDYGLAKYKVYAMNEERKKRSTELVELKERCVKLQQEIQSEQNPARKDELTEQLRKLTRQMEDMDKKITKQMNEIASTIIAELYDDIKEVVDKFAEDKGYDIVFAYPDATTVEELRSAFVKELKLKPPAAQPFFVAKHVDLTAEIIKELNTSHPAPPVPAGEHFNPKPVPGK